MSKEEIREGMENISGGTDTKQGKKPGVKFPVLKYGAPCIKLPKKPTHLAYGGPPITVPKTKNEPVFLPKNPEENN